MVKHIVVWKLKDEFKSKALELKQALESLNGQIPGLLKLEVGIDFSNTETSGSIVLYSKFSSKSMLEIYQKHPKHQEIALIIKEYTHERRMVDYEI